MRELAVMQIHEITLIAGRKGPNRKRVGRGIGSHGKTSGRGHKGEGSRSGSKGYLVKEGGQIPMFRKVAKRGFSAGDYTVQKRIAILNIGKLEQLPPSASEVSIETLISSGLIPRRSQVVRVLGGGELTRALTVEASHVSRSAAAKIREVGGEVRLV